MFEVRIILISTKILMFFKLENSVSSVDIKIEVFCIRCCCYKYNPPTIVTKINKLFILSLLKKLYSDEITKLPLTTGLTSPV